MDDLEALKTKWLGICGACDAGIGECSHPDGDYRPVMLELVREVERLRPVVEAAEAWRPLHGSQHDPCRPERCGQKTCALTRAVDSYRSASPDAAGAPVSTRDERSALREIFDAVHRMMVTNSRDWALDRGDAFLWAVFVGWDPDPGDEPDGAMDEVAARHGWGPERVARLRRFHAAVDAYRPDIKGPADASA